MAKAELTDKLIAELPYPKAGFTLTWDQHATAPPGFGVCVSPGRKSYILSYRSKSGDKAGKERRLSLGYADRRSLLSAGDARTHWRAWLDPGNKPSINVAVAREFARIVGGQIAAGLDPVATRQSARAANQARASAPTVNDLAKDYLAWARLHKRERSVKEDVSLLRQYVVPADDWKQIEPEDTTKRPVNPKLEKRKIGRRKVGELVKADIERLYREVVRGEWSPDLRRTPVRAGLLLILLSRAFNLAIEWGMRSDNPARGIKREPVQRRIRYLDPRHEQEKFIETLDQFSDRHGINAVRLLFLTGARRGEVITATWDQIDLHNGTWTKPSSSTKTKREHVVQLNNQALAVLREMRHTADSGLRRAAILERQIEQEKNPHVRQALKDRITLARAQHAGPFLFPSSRRPGKPLEGIRKLWDEIRDHAGIKRLRLHDLRHNWATEGQRRGVPLHIIGAHLGHTQSSTTQIYAHILPEQEREASNAVGKGLVTVRRGRSTGQVVKLTRERRR